ncbi:hypothetical protein A3Q56_07256 [Intoshia linei]|uniref:Uncharacterized protein n=1 Tax=Intoshia linei TaxID=1819745 RepID=A0A177AUZ5_9BILA|nr:hypothetical protein A3Q56_07256 [Intoshia linei]
MLKDTFGINGLLNYLMMSEGTVNERFKFDCCIECALSDKTKLSPIEYPGSKWEMLGIDLVRPMNYLPFDKRYGITLVDHYSK